MAKIAFAILALVLFGAEAHAQVPDYCKPRKGSCGRAYGQRYRAKCEVSQANPVAMNSCQSSCGYKKGLPLQYGYVQEPSNCWAFPKLY